MGCERTAERKPLRTRLAQGVGAPTLGGGAYVAMLVLSQGKQMLWWP